MCGIGAMVSVLTAKVHNVLLNRKSSGSNNEKHKERRRSSAQPRVIPPEPVQEQPHGDFAYQEIAPALQVHNLARANKASKKLDWDDRLMRDAEAYAQKLAQTGRLQHSGVEDQGENLFMSTDDAKLEDAVLSWTSEEKDYHGEAVAAGKFDEWGHFSQCVWHSTKRVGMGKAKSKDGMTYIVARYTPPGNVVGDKPY